MYTSMKDLTANLHVKWVQGQRYICTDPDYRYILVSGVTYKPRRVTSDVQAVTVQVVLLVSVLVHSQLGVVVMSQ